MKRPKCPDTGMYTREFAGELICYLGGKGDTRVVKTGCWNSILFHYKDLIPRAMKYFETAKEGDPSEAACEMHHGSCLVPLGWAKNVIENATTGKPAEAALAMIMHKRLTDTKWAEGIIERATTGRPVNALATMMEMLEALRKPENYKERTDGRKSSARG